MTSKVTYLGELRTECEHLGSGNKIITDAHLDNQGKDEAFSPTDTVATALASCMLTILGIIARAMSLGLQNSYAEVTKTMAANPRRISRIEINFYLPSNLEEKEKSILENAAKTCPVIYSLHPDIEKDIRFNY